MAGVVQNYDGDVIGHWHDEVDGPCWSYADVWANDDTPDGRKTMCEKGVPIVDPGGTEEDDGD